ncbi:hypothetical protein VTK26DRAFT_490 [Humicola hyalothermophila]
MAGSEAPNLLARRVRTIDLYGSSTAGSRRRGMSSFADDLLRSRSSAPLPSVRRRISSRVRIEHSSEKLDGHRNCLPSWIWGPNNPLFGWGAASVCLGLGVGIFPQNEEWIGHSLPASSTFQNLMTERLLPVVACVEFRKAQAPPHPSISRARVNKRC